MKIKLYRVIDNYNGKIYWVETRMEAEDIRIRWITKLKKQIEDIEDWIEDIEDWIDIDCFSGKDDILEVLWEDYKKGRCIKKRRKQNDYRR